MKLADLESIQKRLDKKNRKNTEENQIKILERAMLLINNDENLEQLNNEFEKKDIKICGLLSTKPKLCVCNVDEDSIAKGNNYTEEFIEKFKSIIPDELKSFNQFIFYEHDTKVEDIASIANNYPLAGDLQIIIIKGGDKIISKLDLFKKHIENLLS